MRPTQTPLTLGLGQSSVARLAGTCDLLMGELRDGLVVTEVGKLPYDSTDHALPDDAQVDLLVHAEDFLAVPYPQGESVIRSWEFRGDETILVVEMPSGATLRCRQRSYSTSAPGTRVSLIPVKAMPLVAFETSGVRA